MFPVSRNMKVLWMKNGRINPYNTKHLQNMQLRDEFFQALSIKNI